MKVLTASIDYLSGISKLDNLNQCEEILDDLAGLINPKDEPFIEQKSVRLGTVYSMTIKSVWKMFGGIKKNKSDGYELLIQLPGQFCRKLENQSEAIKFFSENFRPTRIDIALDDYQRRITQNAIDGLGKKGHYKGVNSYELISSKSGQDSESVSTCYFGALDGNKTIRFYNAEAVHGFEADRWELQARYEYAEEILNSLTINADNPELPQIMGGFVTGAIDFVEPGQNWYHDRRYEFWQNLRDELPAIKLTSPSKEFSLEKMQRWLDRQVCPSLSVLYFGLGRQSYLDLMEAAAIRKQDHLKEHQLNWIQYLQRTKETINL